MTRTLAVWVVISMLVALAGPLGSGGKAYALAFLGPALLSPADGGTVPVGGTFYSRSAALYMLRVETDGTVGCVDVLLLGPNGQQLLAPIAGRTRIGTTGWMVQFRAIGNVSGIWQVFVRGYTSTDCTGPSIMAPTAPPNFVLDLLAPTLSPAIVPAPNAAGWNTTLPVTLNWTAADPPIPATPNNLPGSGIAPGYPQPPSVTFVDQGLFTPQAFASDLVGNSVQRFTQVRIDTRPPTITGGRAPAPNAFGWNNTNVQATFACADPVPASGIASCSPASMTFVASGAGQSVTGTAADNAGNQASLTIGNINIDKVLPTLVGLPTSQPNANGWYNTNVTIAWNFADTLSGIDPATAPANSVISTEGVNQTVSASVSDRAGNQRMAASVPVRIDRTAPQTRASALPFWNNTNVTVNLLAGDNLSGVAATFYRLNGGAQTAGTSVPVSGEGVHALEFWSVDVAGNEEPHRTIQVRIDGTPPTINHTQAPPANAAGWNNTSVLLTFTCADAVSGIASCAGVANATTAQIVASNEGKDQSYAQQAVDNAGNNAVDPATVSIDRTPPVISSGAMPAPNAAGWNNTDVSVAFECTDALSGIANCTPDTMLTTEGANQSVGGSARDAAGNPASTTAGPFNIDKTAPTLSGAALAQPNANGWYNSDVTIEWSYADALSGIDPATAPALSIIGGEGQNLGASARVSDIAGNAAAASVVGINIDRTAPLITAVTLSSPSANGWYSGPVTVHFECSDGLSGIAVGACPADVVLGNDGADQSVTRTVTDLAGNTGNVTIFGINIDSTAPTITGSTSPAANANGWHKTDVTVDFTCADSGSGIDTCSPDVVLHNEGANQQAYGIATDRAGNVATIDLGPVNIDKTAPVLSLPANITVNASGLSGAVVNYSGQLATDALSGFASGATTTPTCSPDSGGLFAAGSTTTVQCSATDLAGNAASASFTIAVNPFSFVGFFQPVDNQPVLNQLRGGQTVPLKWKLHLYAGGPEITDVASVAAGWPRYSAVQCDTYAPVDELELLATGGTSLRYDQTSQQFIYNWQTPRTPGACLRLDVKFTDGQVKSANFRLR